MMRVVYRALSFALSAAIVAIALPLMAIGFLVSWVCEAWEGQVIKHDYKGDYQAYQRDRWKQRP